MEHMCRDIGNTLSLPLCCLLRRCAGHGAVIEGESPLWDLSEVTMSERQLHEPSPVAKAAGARFAVRPCEMEARSEPQHRTKVNLQARHPDLGKRAFIRDAPYPIVVRV